MILLLATVPHSHSHSLRMLILFHSLVRSLQNSHVNSFYATHTHTQQKPSYSYCVWPGSLRRLLLPYSIIVRRRRFFPCAFNSIPNMFAWLLNLFLILLLILIIALFLIFKTVYFWPFQASASPSPPPFARSFISFVQFQTHGIIGVIKNFMSLTAAVSQFQTSFAKK